MSGQQTMCKGAIRQEAPVVEDVAHHQHVDFGERVLEEVARLETEARLEFLLPDVALENRPHGGKIVAVAAEVGWARAISTVRPPCAQPISAKLLCSCQGNAV